MFTRIQELIRERQEIDEELANLFVEFIAKHDKEEDDEVAVEYPE